MVGAVDFCQIFKYKEKHREQLKLALSSQLCALGGGGGLDETRTDYSHTIAGLFSLLCDNRGHRN